MEITINNLVDYVKQHPKRDEVWRGWTDSQLAIAIHEAYQQNALCWGSSERGVLCGLVVGKANTETRTLHIVGILCDTKQIMAQFLLVFAQRFGANWRICGNRKGKLRYFNLKKLCCIAIAQTR